MKKLAVEFEFECDEDWDQMTGDERQRFCAACKKHLVNYSAMTEREAFALLNAQLDDDICGVFVLDGDQIVFQPEVIQQTKFSAAKRLTQAAILSAPLLAACDVPASNSATEPAAIAVGAAGLSAEPPAPPESEPDHHLHAQARIAAAISIANRKTGAIAGRSKYFEVYENDKFGKHFSSTERHWRMKKGGIRPRPRDIMILRGDTPNSQDTAQKSEDD